MTAAIAFYAAFLSQLSRGDEPAEDANAVSENEKAETRVKFMVQALDNYEVEYAEDPSRPSRLHPKPLLRWSNPLTTIKDGALVVYTRGGRPDLVCEFHIHSEDRFGHEFSPIRFEGMRLKRGQQIVFTADNGWFRFQDVPDAPRPAEKAVQRAAQMRQIAERFSVVDEFGQDEDDLQHYVLRLMPRPVYRYEETDEKVDGGMFVFAQGTNPEAVLLVEAVGEGDQARWRFGFAPTTMYELTAHVEGEEGPVVWTKPRYPAFGASSGPYAVMYYTPGPDDMSLKGMMPDPKPKGTPASK
ncbi:MAG TPA: hypothetical protein VG125_02495 [Pirellulales bacterium]|jgi:hypothetical protein|nr:hypothetical protein [Pirellulales bacterium]